MNLPPLPAPFVRLSKELTPVMHAAWADQLRAYGEACARAMQEEAACVARDSADPEGDVRCIAIAVHAEAAIRHIEVEQ